MGFVAYQSGTLSIEAQPKPDPHIVQPAAQPAPQRKNYFPGEKEDLGRVLSNISEALNGEGLSAAQDAFRLTGSGVPQQKAQLQNTIARLETTRKMVRALFNKLYYDIIQKNPRFKTELSDIVGDRDLSNQDSNLMLLERALETYHRDLSILADRYDGLADNDRAVMAILTQRSGAREANIATIEFQRWINECNERIDKMRELLR